MRVKDLPLTRIRAAATYAALPAIGFASTLVVLPAISSKFGAHGWPAIAVGLSLGSSIGVLCELGWGVTGPLHVARAGPRARARLYALSFITQAIAAIPASVVAFLAAFLIAPHFKLEAGLMGFAGCWSALAPSWFFVGAGQPRNVLLTVTLPSIVCSFVAAGAIWLGGGLWLYPLGMLASTAFGLTLGFRLIGTRRHDLRSYSRKRILRAVVIQWAALQGNAVSTLYIMLPTTIVGVVSPGAVGIFAAADRMQRMLLRFLGAVPQSLQNWVGSSGSPLLRRRRALKAIRINTCVGVCFALAFVITGPTASRILFTNQFTISYAQASWCAIVILTTEISRVTGWIALVTYRRIDILRRSAFVGAGVGIVALFVGASAFGASGALAAVALAEVVVVVIQTLGLHREVHRTRTAVPVH